MRTLKALEELNISSRFDTHFNINSFKEVHLFLETTKIKNIFFVHRWKASDKICEDMGEIFNFTGTKSFSYAIKNSSLNLENVKTKTLMKFFKLEQ